MLILGLNAYHADAAACLVRDGRVVAAAEEERFRRIKHWAGFPALAVRWCLDEAGASLADVEHVALNSDPAASLWRKARYALRQRPSLALVRDRIGNQALRLGIEVELAAAGPGPPFRGRVHRVEHHVAHLASAFLASSFEAASVLSVDGFGDFASAAWGMGRGTQVAVEGRVHFPHSLGVFYQALTQHLGFAGFGDEYKVMGLASYGQPRHLAAMRRIVRLVEGGRFTLDVRYFRHHRERIDYAWTGGAPHVGPLFSPALVDLLGPARAAGEAVDARHRDLAASVQATYEAALAHMAQHLHQRHGVDCLALAGGCAQNAVANGRLLVTTPFKRLYVPSAAGDAGGALGAAVHVWHRLEGRSGVSGGDRAAIERADHGPATGEADIATLLEVRRAELETAGCSLDRFGDEGALCDWTATAIEAGAVVGWFQGRMEWGPRALGNRSILCDPRRADTRELLNTRIKLREPFRPFAPSVLAEHIDDWFEAGGQASPFMALVLRVQAAKRSLVPAIVHVDGTARPQRVERHANARFWRLIAAFHARTGVPMLLNTSFNENEPIVAAPAEALDCFLRTGMDVLVLGNHVVLRGARGAPRPSAAVASIAPGADDGFSSSGA